MSRLLQAHGYDPGPSQRPLLTGGLCGLLATLPATGVLHVFGSLAVEARILGLGVMPTTAAGALAMAVAGAVYARLFGRAANDARSGWMFGMAFGFVVWSAGAVSILPIISGGRTPAGPPALGMFLSLIIWGAALGALVPLLQRRLHVSIADAARSEKTGPTVATQKGGMSVQEDGRFEMRRK